MAVALAEAACTTCKEAEVTAKFWLPQAQCSGGRCAYWRTAPCMETCAAYVPLDSLEVVRCAGPRPVVPTASGVGGPDDREVECTYVDQVCKTEPSLGSGRPPRGHRPLGPTAGTDRVGIFFARAAEAEEASVFAFEELADALAPVDAKLARRCRAAAREEERHRSVMTGLALARSVAPSRATVAPSAWGSMADLARDNATQGMVEELWSAAMTLFAATRARDEAVRRAFGPVAVDEARHAELAFSIDRALAGLLSPAEAVGVLAARQEAVDALERTIDTYDDASPLVRAGLIPPRAGARAMFAALFGAEGAFACAA